ncbi:SIMPL domain-containing protein [Algoriphagus yeomjeoni]|uniref:SIMPL domain-containing protein n=1 Tax=Algoriphagus yeomjeoni TaxID=291403 RepID=UPI003CE5A0E5
MIGIKQTGLIAILLFICASVANAQNTTISVEGTGEISEKPDVGFLNITIETKAAKFGNAISQLNSKTDSLYLILSDMGFEQENIKTSNFNVRENFIFNNNIRSKDGFIGVQRIEAEFPFSKEQLGTIINRFAEGETSVQFDFSFGLSDSKMEELKKALIKNAIQDATIKAELIAQNTGKVLGQMEEINYSRANPFYRTALKETVVGYGSSQGQSAGFEIKDVNLTDTIVITWSMK